MYKSFLKGMYYIPEENEDPYSILKNANKNKLNFIILEYTNNILFTNKTNNKKQFLNLFYIQDKINSFEKKYKNTIGIICFKCRSIIGPIRILLSKSIFSGEILKLQNFSLWCYLNNPTLILSNTNYPNIKNQNIKNFFTLYTDNFLKSTDNYINLLNSNLKLTPIHTDNGFIFIKNLNNSIFDFLKLKAHIYSEIKNGNFYISNSDKFYLNIDVNPIKDEFLRIKIQINSENLFNQNLILINDKNKIIKKQNVYNLKNIYYDLNIKNSANKFLIFKITSKNDLFALTQPFYINKTIT